MPGPCSGGCPAWARAGAVVEASVPANVPAPSTIPVAGADFSRARLVRPETGGIPDLVFELMRCLSQGSGAATPLGNAASRWRRLRLKRSDRTAQPPVTSGSAEAEQACPMQSSARVMRPEHQLA